MIRAAGIMLVFDGKALFLKRSMNSDHPGEWCFPGGRIEDNESAEGAAIRECIEEIGFLPAGERVELTRSLSSPPSPDAVAGFEEVEFTTFLQSTPQEVIPRLNEEHSGYAWASLDTPPEPLHPGCRIALARQGMHEMDIAKAIAIGELTSPQRYHNMWLFAMRITGSGLAYRTAKKEYVWRDAALHITDDMAQRCAALPVLWEHPKEALLDEEGKEYVKRVIGAIMLPYIKDNTEIWGIARIHDGTYARKMRDEQYSTSPGVRVGGEGDRMLRTADGTPLLVEDLPVLIDHVAVCDLGVWDKGGKPVGVSSQTIGDIKMTEDEIKAMADKARKDADDEKARKDAEDGGKLDRILSHLDAASSRMDAFEKRMNDSDKAKADAAEAEEKKKADDDMMDASARRDAEHKEWMEKDSAMCAKDDADEEKEAKEHESKGETKEMAADKARKDRKDRMDKRKADAEKDEKEKADAAARADSVAAQVDARLKERLPRTYTQEETNELADIQARADSACVSLGKRAPAPMLGEEIRAYRLRMIRGMQDHSPEWKGVDLASASNTLLDKIERTVYADAQKAGLMPPDLGEHELRLVTTVEPETGLRTNSFVGRHSFLRSMAPNGLRVSKFNTPANH